MHLHPFLHSIVSAAPGLFFYGAALLIIATGRSKATGKLWGIIGLLLLLGGDLLSVASNTVYLQRQNDMTLTDIRILMGVSALVSKVVSGVGIVLIAVGLRRAMSRVPTNPPLPQQENSVEHPQ